MQPAAIKKDKLNQVFVDAMAAGCVIAPVRTEGKVYYREIADPKEIDFCGELPAMSPKEFLMPSLQKLMTFDAKGAVSMPDAPPKALLFAVKPCDLDAIRTLTALFTTGPYQDPYYGQALENTLIIGMACSGPQPGCFCHERGIDPKFSQQCDIFLTDLGDRYQVEAFTEGGEAACSSWLLEPLAAPARRDIAGMELLELNLPEEKVFKETPWGRITERCLGCGICTYLCPTCHCFAFKDVSEGTGAHRYRLWDSCMIPKFTLHASGHNPRPSKKERFRQRLMHKYAYMKKNLGRTACSGCGRCIRSCPAGMDIRAAVTGIGEVLK